MYNADSNGLEFYNSGGHRYYTGLQDKTPVNMEALKKPMITLFAETIPVLGGEPKRYVDRTVHPHLWLDPEEAKTKHKNSEYYRRYEVFMKHKWEWALIKGRGGGVGNKETL